MVKYHSLLMCFDESFCYPDVARFLMQEKGLKKPNRFVFEGDEGELPTKLVYEMSSEDYSGYRVDFRIKEFYPDSGVEGGKRLFFRYWQRGIEICEGENIDPMLITMQEVYDKFKPYTLGVGGAILREIQGRP